MDQSERRSPTTSLVWLDRLITGNDPADWEKLIHLYEPLLKYWALRAGVPERECEDVVQDVLLVVVRRLGEFQHQREGAFRAWLRAILSNYLKRYFRERPPRAPLIDLEAISASDSAVQRSLDREHEELLFHRALVAIKADFSESTWAAFQRLVIEGLPAEQVAGELGLTVNAVHKSKLRVLARLREELERLNN